MHIEEFWKRAQTRADPFSLSLCTQGLNGQNISEFKQHDTSDI